MSSDPNICYSCEKSFSSRYNLNKHQRTSVSCRPITCPCCSKIFTPKTLEEHIGLCVSEKLGLIKNFEKELKEKDNQLKTQEELHAKKIEDQDKYYDRLIVNETISKEKLRNEMRIKETIHKEQLDDLKKTIENLHIKIEKLVASKSASTVNNIINNGNVNLNTFITPEFVKAQATEFLTYDHFANGVKGLANFVHDFILMDKNGKLVYACYDKARHILRYKDEEDNEIDDIDAEKLIGIVERPIKDKYFKICKDLKADIERYQRILDDDDECSSMKRDARERKEKCERCLRVMEFQCDAVSTIGMSKNKEFSRAIEKRCLAPKVGRAKKINSVEVIQPVEEGTTHEVVQMPPNPLPSVVVEEEKDESPPVEEEENDSVRIGKKLEFFKQKMLDEEAEKTKEVAKEAAKYTPYKFKGCMLHKETSFVFDKNKKVVGKSIYEEGDEMLGELEDSDRELCKKLNFEVEDD